MSQTQTPPVTPPSHRNTDPDRLGRRLQLVALELAVLGAAWYLMGIYLYVVVAIAAVIIVGGVVPYRYGGVASGLGFLGLAAGAYFYVRFPQLAVLLAIVGVLRLAFGVPMLVARR